MLLERGWFDCRNLTSHTLNHSMKRISINGQGIPDQDLIGLVNKYQPLVEQLDRFEAVSGITEFETLTAMAFDYF